MLERIDLENLDDLTETLKELKLEPHHAPLVFTLEVLLKKLKSGGTPSGLAQVAAQINAIMKELLASNDSQPSRSEVLNSFRK